MTHCACAVNYRHQRDDEIKLTSSTRPISMAKEADAEAGYPGTKIHVTRNYAEKNLCYFTLIYYDNNYI